MIVGKHTRAEALALNITIPLLWASYLTVAATGLGEMLLGVAAKVMPGVVTIAWVHNWYAATAGGFVCLLCCFALSHWRQVRRLMR